MLTNSRVLELFDATDGPIGGRLLRFSRAIEAEVRAEAQPVAECCNGDCGWTGTASECCMLGSVGPLCPECKEVVEIAPQPPAKQEAQPAKFEHCGRAERKVCDDQQRLETQPPAPCPKCASGILCADCNDTGWLENREEGRYPCTCMTEAEPYQLLQAKVAILDGLSQDAIDGGWTYRGMEAYAKGLEAKVAELETIKEGVKQQRDTERAAYLREFDLRRAQDAKVIELLGKAAEQSAEIERLTEALKLCEGNISSLAAAHPRMFTDWLVVVRSTLAKAAP